MSAVRHARVAFLIAVVLSAIAITGCGDTVIDDDKAEDAIGASLEESVERKVAAVDCPSDQQVEAGATFNCTVRFANGDKATANLKILNKDADVSLVGLKANE